MGASICCAGGRAVGLSGRDDALVRAVKKKGDVDLGLVGDPSEVAAERRWLCGGYGWPRATLLAHALLWRGACWHDCEIASRSIVRLPVLMLDLHTSIVCLPPVHPSEDVVSLLAPTDEVWDTYSFLGKARAFCMRQLR